MNKLDKGIPMPPDGRSVFLGRRRKYPYVEAKVGDSFLARRNMITEINKWAKRRGRLFTSRITKGSKKGVRIWRVK